VGINDPLLIMLDITPPTVSIPKDKGVASIKIIDPASSPHKIPPVTAAPWATASSGLIP